MGTGINGQKQKQRIMINMKEFDQRDLQEFRHTTLSEIVHNRASNNREQCYDR